MTKPDNTPVTATPLLEVRNIETYYGPVMAVRGVSMQVKTGSIVTLLGGNGAGKTTILKTISGAMEPQKGSVSLSGVDITNREPDWIARQGLAHVPEGREVFPFLTVEQNLQMGAFARRSGDATADMDLVYGYFPILKEFYKRQAEYLSGGQQQMLAIGRALMARPSVMLLDEPSLGLSPKLVGDIAEIIVRLNREQGVTILLIEQNAKMALDVADFGYVLENGRIVMEDTTERLKASTDIQAFYLGVKEQGVRGRRRWKQRKTWR